MSRAYKLHKPDGLYFITFATVGWVDVFTRCDHKDIEVKADEAMEHVLALPW